ncbi:hypothetical protein F0562_024032 [Nyssa sinensis]|uniref:Uncharacterized protein n=1 Tax=Nyssa sinensis TaxID=561372 RepID=A0A5J5BKX0_9ASTE|nr:hypothetical protein F0562_024032 [Nyssa sinensis]
MESCSNKGKAVQDASADILPADPLQVDIEASDQAGKTEGDFIPQVALDLEQEFGGFSQDCTFMSTPELVHSIINQRAGDRGRGRGPPHPLARAANLEGRGSGELHSPNFPHHAHCVSHAEVGRSDPTAVIQGGIDTAPIKAGLPLTIAPNNTDAQVDHSAGALTVTTPFGTRAAHAFSALSSGDSGAELKAKDKTTGKPIMPFDDGSPPPPLPTTLFQMGSQGLNKQSSLLLSLVFNKLLQ